MTTISPGSMSRTKLGADDVEGAGLRGEDRRAFEVAEHQRPDAERVAHADHLLRRQADQRERALEPRQRVDQLLDEQPRAAGRDEMEDRLGVGGRGEDRAAALQFALHGQGVGDVAVVGDGEAAGGQFGEERLDVAQAAAAGRGVARMADGRFAGQPLQDGLPGEGVADQAGVPLDVELRPVEGHDARRFLAAVLQGVQAESHQGRGVRALENAENAALLVQRVIAVRRVIHGSFRRLAGS